jgi:hypothetical protein
MYIACTNPYWKEEYIVILVQSRFPHNRCMMGVGTAYNIDTQ